MLQFCSGVDIHLSVSTRESGSVPSENVSRGGIAGGARGVGLVDGLVKHIFGCQF